MSNYDDTNRGALFKNDKKEKDTHPDYKGPMNFNGQEGWLAAWLKKSKDGRTYMSLSWDPKDGEREAAKADDLDDSIPF